MSTISSIQEKLIKSFYWKQWCKIRDKFYAQKMTNMMDDEHLDAFLKFAAKYFYLNAYAATTEDDNI